MGDNGGMTPVAQRRWFGPLIGLVTFMVVLVPLGAGGVAVDSGIRIAEMNELLTKVEASELEMMVVQEEIERVSSDFEALPDPTDEDRQELVKELATTAAVGQEAIAEAGAAISAAEIAPWHVGVQEARDDYLAHSQAWQEYLGRAKEDPLELTRPQELVDSTFLESEESMRAAVPSILGSEILARVDVIYAEPEGESSGTGQAA